MKTSCKKKIRTTSHSNNYRNLSSIIDLQTHVCSASDNLVTLTFDLLNLYHACTCHAHLYLVEVCMHGNGMGINVVKWDLHFHNDISICITLFPITSVLSLIHI